MKVFKESSTDTELLHYKRPLKILAQHHVKNRKGKETTDAQSMKLDVIPLSVEFDDVKEYVDTVRLFQLFKAGEPLNFCKSAPYLPYFMQTYAYNDRIDKCFPTEIYQFTQEENPDEVKIKVRPVLDGKNLKYWKCLKNYYASNPLMTKIEGYQPIPIKNAAVRQLSLEMLGQQNGFEPWKLLWLPPTFSYWEVTYEGVRKELFDVFESAKANEYSKRLIFSGWNVVPDAIRGCYPMRPSVEWLGLIIRIWSWFGIFKN